jgi:hypothetical protein
MNKSLENLMSNLLNQLSHLEVSERYDDARRAEKNEILLGSGRALDMDQRGIALNWKGTPYRSNTELIERIDDETVSGWCKRLSYLERLQGVHVGVADLGPDTCLSFIILYCRLNGSNLADFPLEWIDYATRWEEGDVKTTGKPSESWGCLLNALGHSYWQRTSVPGEPSGKLVEEQLKVGFGVCVSFTLGLMLAKCRPDRIAYAGARSLDEYHQARALVDYERKIYLQALQHAKLVQLDMPLLGSDRRTLIDAFIVSDLTLTGTMKTFIRNDTDHPWLGMGFPFMALYHPSERGTGGDITISVDPSSRITLKELHREIEILESERWLAHEKNRPSNQPRNGYKWNQPWYLEPHNESLIGAPLWLVQGQQHGSELQWQDIMDLLWKLYNPARNLQVTPYGADAVPSAVHLCEPTAHHGKRLLAVKWMPGDINQCLVLSPTMKRYLMATITRPAVTQEEIRLDDLPPELGFDFLALPGGFALIHAGGVFLMDDWSRDALAVNTYQKEFEQAVRRCEVLDEIELSMPEIIRWMQELPDQNPIKEEEDEKHLKKLADQRTVLMTTILETTSRATDLHAAQFRETFEKRLGIASQLDQLYRMLGELLDECNRKVQRGILESQEKTRMWAERFQAVVSGLAVVIVVMAVYHEIIQIVGFHHWPSDLGALVFAVVLGFLVFWFLYRKASAGGLQDGKHTEDQPEHLAREVAVHTRINQSES